MEGSSAHIIIIIITSLQDKSLIKIWKQTYLPRQTRLNANVNVGFYIGINLSFDDRDLLVPVRYIIGY